MIPDYVAAFRLLIGPFQRKIALMIGRGIVDQVDDSGPLQKIQMIGLGGQTVALLDNPQGYGFGSRPKPGAEIVYGAIGGIYSHLVVLTVGDRRYRIPLQEGEAVQYDDQGQKVHIARDAITIDTGSTGNPVNINTSGSVNINATGDVVVVAGGSVQLGAAGGKKVALDGDPVIGGVVKASSTKVKGT